MRRENEGLAQLVQLESSVTVFTQPLLYDSELYLLLHLRCRAEQRTSLWPWQLGQIRPMRTAAPTRAKEGTLLVCTRLLAQRSGPRLQGSGVHTPAVLSSCPDMVLFPVEVSGEAQSMCSSSLTPHYTLNPKP